MATKKIKITIRSLEDSFKEAKKFASEIDKGIFKKQRAPAYDRIRNKPRQKRN